MFSFRSILGEKSVSRLVGILSLTLSLIVLYGWLGSITEDCVLEIYPRGQIQLCDPLGEKKTEIGYGAPAIASILAFAGIILIAFDNKKLRSNFSKNIARDE